LHFAFALALKDLRILKKFCATPQKRLDMHCFCTHNGARYTIAFALRFRTGAAAPLDQCQTAFGEVVSGGGKPAEAGDCFT